MLVPGQAKSMPDAAGGTTSSHPPRPSPPKLMLSVACSPARRASRPAAAADSPCWRSASPEVSMLSFARWAVPCSAADTLPAALPASCGWRAGARGTGVGGMDAAERLRSKLPAGATQVRATCPKQAAAHSLLLHSRAQWPHCPQRRHPAHPGWHEPCCRGTCSPGQGWPSPQTCRLCHQGTLLSSRVHAPAATLTCGQTAPVRCVRC